MKHGFPGVRLTSTMRHAYHHLRTLSALKLLSRKVLTWVLNSKNQAKEGTLWCGPSKLLVLKQLSSLNEECAVGFCRKAYSWKNAQKRQKVV